jgi:hypothetical protein
MKFNPTQPFLRVYDTRGLEEDEVNELLDRNWSSKSDPQVIMRSAIFGQSSTRLDMCVSERSGHVLDLSARPPVRRPVTGIEDRNLVPLAIIQALRKSSKFCSESIYRSL